jgi:hypothetical protein
MGACFTFVCASSNELLTFILLTTSPPNALALWHHKLPRHLIYKAQFLVSHSRHFRLEKHTHAPGQLGFSSWKGDQQTSSGTDVDAAGELEVSVVEGEVNRVVGVASVIVES